MLPVLSQTFNRYIKKYELLNVQLNFIVKEKDTYRLLSG